MTYPNDPSAPQGAPVASGAKRASLLGTWGARIVLIIVAACALISVVFILFGVGGDTISRVVMTDVALIVFAFLVWLDTVIGRYRAEWFELASLATDAYLLLLWVLTAWTGADDGYSRVMDWLNVFLGLLFVRGMLGLVDLTRWLWSRWRDQVTRILAYVAGAAFGVLAVMVSLPTPHPFNGFWNDEAYGRIVASVAVIGGVALVLVPLWGLLTQRQSPAAAPSRSGYAVPEYPVAPGYSFGPGSPFASTAPVHVAPTTPVAAPAQTVPDAPVPVSAPSPASPGFDTVAAVAPEPQTSPSPQTSEDIEETTAERVPTARPPLAWPRLQDGRVIPVGADGRPDFAAVAGIPLAWPTHADGSPVPAGPDGTPLYH